MECHGFKIRDNFTGLYACKGMKWSKVGKVWTKLSHLTCALLSSGIETIPPQWEIIVLTEKGGINCDIVINSKFKEKDVLECI